MATSIRQRRGTATLLALAAAAGIAHAARADLDGKLRFSLSAWSAILRPAEERG